MTICSSELPYNWNGLIFTSAGSQTATGFTNVNGCDSTATLHLTINTGSSSIADLTICPAQLPYSWNGLTFTAAGSQTATGFTNVAGCDSSATLNLSVNAVVNSLTSLAICTSELPYSWNGLIFTGAGTQTATGFTNIAGCDSNATLNLAVNAVSASTTDLTICSSELPYSWNGLTFTVAGSQTKAGFTNALGCDSTATLNLSVNEVSNSISNLGICASGLPYSWNGLTFTAAGTQTATGFTNAAGCDSTATLNLSVNAAASYSFTETICQGDVYSFNGEVLTSPGIYYDTLVAQSGCDSIVILNLQTNQINLQAVVNGVTCSAAQNNAAYQWLDCNTGQQISGADAQSYTATQNGSYACILYKDNCTDTTDCVIVTALGIGKPESYTFTLYPNPNNGIFTLTHNYPALAQVHVVNLLGQQVAAYDLTTPTALLDIKHLAAGAYYLQVWSGSKKLATRLVVKE